MVSLNIDRGDEKTIETISEHQELQLLSLRRFETPFDVEFIGIGKLRNLIHLDLSYCRRYVTNELITNVVENSKNLRMLDLNGKKIKIKLKNTEEKNNQIFTSFFRMHSNSFGWSRGNLFIKKIEKTTTVWY